MRKRGWFRRWCGRDVKLLEFGAKGHRLGSQFPWLCAPLEDDFGFLIVVPNVDVLKTGEWSDAQVGVRLSDLVDHFITVVDDMEEDDATCAAKERAAAIEAFEDAIARIRA